MTSYAESSAVLSWLLGEPTGEEVRACLKGARSVVTSDLTLIECDRVLTRAIVVGGASEADVASRRARFARAAARWSILHMTSEVVERARRPFPSEPMRSLDAIHLSSALFARSFLPDLAVLSLDERIRENAAALGFEVLP